MSWHQAQPNQSNIHSWSMTKLIILKSMMFVNDHLIVSHNMDVKMNSNIYYVKITIMNNNVRITNVIMLE